MSNQEQERIFKYVSEGVIPEEKPTLPAAKEYIDVPFSFYKECGFSGPNDPLWLELPEAEQRLKQRMYNMTKYAKAIAVSGGYME
jgi:hypothetical protein